MFMYEMKKDNFECHLEDQIRIRVNKFFNVNKIKIVFFFFCCLYVEHFSSQTHIHTISYHYTFIHLFNIIWLITTSMHHQLLYIVSATHFIHPFPMLRCICCYCFRQYFDNGWITFSSSVQFYITVYISQDITKVTHSISYSCCLLE